jgi:predicted AlkP superfamily phosphohydrolase/phosphomutase
MMVEMALDRLHHGFWRYFRTDHRFYDPENPYKDVIPEVYQHVDSCLGSLLARLDDDVTVIVVSDHGAKSMQGGICINEWLRMKGYLTLKSQPATPAALTYDNVDWRNTSAWSEGGYYGRIFVNVEGREPDGIVKPAAYEAFLAELSAELEAITDENGLQMKNSVHRPADLYREVAGSPPDLLVYFDDLSRRCVGDVGAGKIHVFENNTGPDDANHDFYGIFICAQMRNLRSGTKMGKQLEGLNLLDITPTILDLFGVPVPSNLGGRIIKPNAVIRDDKFDIGSICICVDESSGLTSGEEAIIQQRLADLGYI